jgi:hypothetical protein
MKLTKRVIAATGGVVFALGVLVGQVAMAYQEHMHAALDALRTARHELAVAEENKGGHRAAALQLVDQAIDEVRAGIDYGR